MKDIHLQRFMSKVLPEPNSGCWLWMGSVNTHGYSQISIACKMKKGHRLAYEHFIGPIPEGMQIDHLCRVRSCVNPQHLEAVTQHVNMERGVSGQKNRAKTHCPQGHPYEGDNLKISGKRKARVCKQCKRDEALKRKWEAIAADPKGYREADARRHREKRARDTARRMAVANQELGRQGQPAV